MERKEAVFLGGFNSVVVLGGFGPGSSLAALMS